MTLKFERVFSIQKHLQKIIIVNFDYLKVSSVITKLNLTYGSNSEVNCCLYGYIIIVSQLKKRRVQFEYKDWSKWNETN